MLPRSRSARVRIPKPTPAVTTIPKAQNLGEFPLICGRDIHRNPCMSHNTGIKRAKRMWTLTIRASQIEVDL